MNTTSPDSPPPGVSTPPGLTHPAPLPHRPYPARGPSTYRVSDIDRPGGAGAPKNRSVGVTGRNLIFDAFAVYAEAPPGRPTCRIGPMPGRGAALGGMFGACYKKTSTLEGREAPATRKNDII